MLTKRVVGTYLFHSETSNYFIIVHTLPLQYKLASFRLEQLVTFQLY